MDQGVLECMKRIYSKSVLRDLIAQGGDNMIAYLNTLHMLNVIEQISSAWSQASPETIRRSWNKLIPIPDPSNAEISSSENIVNKEFVRKFEELNIIVSGDDIDSWFAADGTGYEHFDKNGIIELINSEDADDNDEE